MFVYILNLKIVLSVLLVALLHAILSGVFSSQVMGNADISSTVVVNANPVYTGFLTFWSYIILLSPAMPIALYISLVTSSILTFNTYMLSTPVFTVLSSMPVCPQV